MHLFNWLLTQIANQPIRRQHLNALLGNPSRSADLEILRPARLAPITMPRLKSHKFPFFSHSDAQLEFQRVVLKCFSSLCVPIQQLNLCSAFDPLNHYVEHQAAMCSPARCLYEGELCQDLFITPENHVCGSCVSLFLTLCNQETPVN